MSRIGIDVDGVLADFNSTYIDLVVKSTGRDLFPPRPFNIPCWDYDLLYGYTKEELKSVWKTITASGLFWRTLRTYPGEENLVYLTGIQYYHDLYFITNRPGKTAKFQTEDWLFAQGFSRPTVLISANKGLCAAALELDEYIDDKFENVRDVVEKSSKTQAFILSRPWNKDLTPFEARRVSNCFELGRGMFK